MLEQRGAFAGVVDRPASALLDAGIPRRRHLSGPARSGEGPRARWLQPGLPAATGRPVLLEPGTRAHDLPDRAVESARDRARDGDQALPEGDAVRARRPTGRTVRHDARGLACRPARPSKLLPAPRRHDDPPREQHQLRVLQRSRVQPADRGSRRNAEPCTGIRVRPARRRDRPRRCAVGCIRGPERQVLLLRPGRVPALRARIHAESRGALPPPADLDRRRHDRGGERRDARRNLLDPDCRVGAGGLPGLGRLLDVRRDR